MSDLKNINYFEFYKFSVLSPSPLERGFGVRTFLWTTILSNTNYIYKIYQSFPLLRRGSKGEVKKKRLFYKYNWYNILCMMVNSKATTYALKPTSYKLTLLKSVKAVIFNLMVRYISQNKQLFINTKKRR